MRGELFLKRGDNESAEMDFKTVLELDKVVSSTSCRHYALFFLGKRDYALQWMDKIIQQTPSDPGNYYDKACLYARMGLVKESIEALEIAFVNGYRSFAHIEHDNDLDPIRNMAEYKDIIKKYYVIYEEELTLFK